MSMTLEKRIERLQEVIAAYKAVSDMDDDGEDWSMQTIVMEDVPELISAIQLQQAEIERLREVDDRSSAVSIECQILWELVEDPKVADDLLSDYPTIAFYTRVKEDDGSVWKLVYGKKIGYKGVEFGVYFTPTTNVWHVVELESGRSIGYVEEFRKAFIRLESVIDWKGVDYFKAEVDKTVEKLSTPPAAPRLIGIHAVDEPEEMVGQDAVMPTRRQ